MQRSDFSYFLPEQLIAQSPTEKRTASRLLHLNPLTNALQDVQFTDFPDFLQPNDLLVFNDTRVIPARLFGHKPSGGRVEILIERLLDNQRVIVQLRASKMPKPNTLLHLEGDVTATVIQRLGEFSELRFEDDRPVIDILHAIGHIPLPPYVRRLDTSADVERYQTVYARQPGAVAAPTAGLHFDERLLSQIRQRGIETTFITLHVGAGTFSPMRVEKIDDHVMHAEWLQVSETVCQQVHHTRARGGRVVAVGTTTVRALETASHGGQLAPFSGETRLFITPGYVFHSVDALLTNFHLPESTLLMLVCAFAGQELTLAAYRHAVAQQYRFFSYGDAMFISHPKVYHQNQWD